ncbi:MAG: hypothetical protein HGA78_07170, partial [Nitrospirales bacterium]|nr:hypothetical protein [Nitrospirales bacterium]
MSQVVCLGNEALDPLFSCHQLPRKGLHGLFCPAALFQGASVTVGTTAQAGSLVTMLAQAGTEAPPAAPAAAPETKPAEAVPAAPAVKQVAAKPAAPEAPKAATASQKQDHKDYKEMELKECAGCHKGEGVAIYHDAD